MLVLGCFLLAIADGQQVSPGVSNSTPEHWKETGWWPTKGTAARSEFAGAETCAQCHAGIAESQRKTPMFSAASRPSSSPLLEHHTRLPFSDSAYDYLLLRDSAGFSFSVSDKSGTITAPIDWAFGTGEVAQTYILKREGIFLESRLSYYTGPMVLGITPGHQEAAPASLSDAIGDPIEDATLPRCFGCHSTASTVSGTFDADHAVLGVTCEACHGPGTAHVAAMRSGKVGLASATIFSATRLSPVNSVDFCGACHRTPADVAGYMPANMGIANIRFQPYRLERSLCWGDGRDARITCVACHDPHQPLVRDSAAYDSKCLKCHAATGTGPSLTNQANGPGAPRVQTLQPGCKVASTSCTSCHMRKYDLPAVHGAFTDHYIRVVAADAPFRR